MAAPVGKFTVQPATATLVVSVAFRDSSSPGELTCWTGQDGGTTRTMPLTITANTDFWMAAGRYTVTCKLNGVVIDTTNVDIQPGTGQLIAPDIDSFTEKASELGTSVAVDNTAYGAGAWDGDTTHAPSKNAVRDKIEAIRTEYVGVGRGRGMVCFTWDDSWEDFVTEVEVLADQLGQRHTFCQISDMIDTAGRMTSAQVTAMWNKGHEIASHSKTHTDMTTQTSAQRQAEFDTSKSVLEALTAPGAVQTFCFPFGGTSATIRQELYLRYSRQLEVGSGTTSFYLYGPTRTHVQRISRFVWGSANHQRLLDLIRLCATQPWRLVVLAHDPSTGAEPTWTQVQEAMNLCASLGVPAATVSEAFASIQLVPNAGFEDTPPGTDLGAWEPVLVGTGVAEIVTDTPSTGLTGAQSLHLKGLANTDSATARCIVPCGPSIQIALQGRYRVSRTSGAGTITATIQQYDGSGAPLGSATATADLTSTTWAQFSVSITTPSNQGAFVWITLSLVNLTAEAWFDHIHFAPTAEGNFG